MGLLGNLFGGTPKKHPANQSTKNPQQLPYTLNPWKLPDAVRYYSIGGPQQSRVYVHDSSPLQGVRDGEWFQLSVFPGSALMTSVYTSAIGSTSKDDVLLMYAGKPVGFTHMQTDQVMKLAKRGILLTIPAFCNGFVEGYYGVRNVTASTFGKVVADDILEEFAAIDAGIRPNATYSTIGLYREEDYATLASRKQWVFDNASLKMIPAPSGSSAKPHVGLYSSKGKLITEIGAQNSAYKKWVALIGREARLYVTAKKVSGKTGQDYYRRTIRV